MVLRLVRLTYTDVVVHSEQKEDLMVGAYGHGVSNAFDQRLGALEPL